MKVLYSMLLVSALASGCVRARANTTPDAPLDVPEPPPREVAPNDVEPPPPVPLVAEPARSELPRPSAPRVQTTPATAEAEVERGIRASLTRATAELSRIDYRALNPDARTQYDTAKRFIRQADDAIRSKNLVFAKSFADKAATIAAQLGGR